MTKLMVPESAYGWLNEEIKAALAEIEPPHVAKKRATVIKLAQAAAQQTPMKTVFEAADTCNESIWYIKWQFDEKIARALALAERRCLEWVDEQTAAQEEFFRQQRRKALARWAAQAPDALADVMLSQGQRGADRISAADLLMRWAEPSQAQQSGPAQPPAGEQTINLGLFAGLSEPELDQVIDNLALAARGQGEQADDVEG